MLKSIKKIFRQPNRYNFKLTYTIDDIYEELYDTRLDLTLNTKSSTQMYHSSKSFRPLIRSDRMQKADMQHPYQTLADHKSSSPRTAYSPRTNNKPITCEACGLTQRELHQLLCHIQIKAP